MNGIKVKITQLGRVRDSEIIVSPFMVFSGESGLGKSYLALLCHYFFELMVNVSRLNHFFIENGIDYNVLSKDFNDVGNALTIKKADLEKWMAKDAILYLRYMLGHEGLQGSIDISLPKSFPDILTYAYKKELTGLVDAEDINTILSLESLSYRIQEKTQFDESPFSLLLRLVLVKHVIGSYFSLDGTFVLPPSRGPVLTEQMIPTTGMYMEFLNDMTDLNRIKPRPDTASETVLDLFNKILEGEVKKEENNYIYMTGSMSMPVSAAAASIREIAPLQMLAKKRNVSKCAILVEEPEAHLHPLKQRMMADIMGALCHDGAIMQITTHSDYFLRRLNELIIYARACKLDGKSEDLNRLSEDVHIVAEMAIDESSIGAYQLVRNTDGTSKAIRQDLSDGVPFAAFSDAIRENINNQDKLEAYFYGRTE